VYASRLGPKLELTSILESLQTRLVAHFTAQYRTVHKRQQQKQQPLVLFAEHIVYCTLYLQSLRMERSRERQVGS
jgi:hypothetical protein